MTSSGGSTLFPAFLISQLPETVFTVRFLIWVRCHSLYGRRQPSGTRLLLPRSAKTRKRKGNGLTSTTQFYIQPENPHNCKCHEFNRECKFNSLPLPRFRLLTHTGSSNDFPSAGSIPDSLTRRFPTQPRPAGGGLLNAAGDSGRAVRIQACRSFKKPQRLITIEFVPSGANYCPAPRELRKKEGHPVLAGGKKDQPDHLRGGLSLGFSTQ